jgi:hypothetical protein
MIDENPVSDVTVVHFDDAKLLYNVEQVSITLLIYELSYLTTID